MACSTCGGKRTDLRQPNIGNTIHQRVVPTAPAKPQTFGNNSVGGNNGNPFGNLKYGPKR